jgi:glyoxylase-like metal-dependent hydrolase (beta-lactamase superfamily II)
MKRVIVTAVLLGIGALSISVAGLQNPQTPPALDIQKVKDNLYMIITPNFGAGNTAALVTDAGVVLVDTKTPGNAQGIIDKVKSVTNKPIIMVINTHTHADHTGSNDGFTGKVEFVAQDNTKVNMTKMDAFKGANAKFIPSKTYKDKLTLGAGKDAIELHYYGRAHTNGDTFVVFPALRVMHSGDAFAGKNAPLIDADNGGSAVEYGETLGKAAASAKNIDTIITGHSALMKPADLQEYADFNKDFITWVKAEIRAGKTAEQAAAEYKLPERYKNYTILNFFGGIKGNIATAYKELKK